MKYLMLFPIHLLILQTLENMGVLIRPKQVVVDERLNDRLQHAFYSQPCGKRKLKAMIIKLFYPFFLYYDNFQVNYPLGSYAISLFKTDDLNTFGNELIFKDLISKLNFLESTGIDISLIVFDNLGLHTILGFVQSFVACYLCRFCKTHRNVCHNQTIQDDNSLRNAVNYLYNVASNSVSISGIRELCDWDQVYSFSVISNYSVDIMHDLLEGVCNYDIDIRNIPPLISEENLIRQDVLKMSASEMLCLTKYLRLIIGDLIPEQSELWLLYIILKKILDIVLEEIILLQTLILEHHELYLRLSHSNLKPKHHHMVHYPLIISQSGPLSHHWCMRFEAKHKKLKETANYITSKKNITLTLSLKQQLQLAYRLLATTNNMYSINIYIYIYCPCQNYFFHGLVLSLCQEHNSMLPLFGLIKSVFVNEMNKPFAICNQFNTLYFDEHCQSSGGTTYD
ncbi:hypothetical protein AGLY_013932 [Aphis glycines]|uniref:Uncharacterized protein n=1 Tax=Aphis glycines TaxID=307491 RepID=A0A6G0T4Y4_APHGL|nr:hypothetical protein AGLY_013932 [Aphis glycines]